MHWRGGWRKNSIDCFWAGLYKGANLCCCINAQNIKNGDFCKFFFLEKQVILTQKNLRHLKFSPWAVRTPDELLNDSNIIL